MADTYMLTVPVPATWAQALKDQAVQQHRPRVAVVRDLIAKHLDGVLPPEELAYVPGTPGRKSSYAIPFNGGDDLRQVVLHLYALGYGIGAVETIACVSYNAIWGVLDDAGVEIRGFRGQVPLTAGDVVLLLQNPDTPADVLCSALELDEVAIELLRQRQAALQAAV
jgi:hypothetical protein